MDNKAAIKYLVYWVFNIILLAFAYALYPDAFELGNKNLGAVTGVIFSGFLLVNLNLVAKGLARTTNVVQRGRMFKFLYYWVSTSFGIWIVARIANISGFGIAKFTWALALGFFITFTHWVLRQAFKGMKLV